MKMNWIFMSFHFSFILWKTSSGAPFDVPMSENRPFIDYASFHPDQILNQDQPRTIDSQPDSVSTGCVSGDSTYEEGETWHPEVRPFGLIECVVCSCTRGDIECERLQCPPAESLPCNKPEVLPGNCCKTCHTKRNLQRTFLPDQLLSGSPVSAASPGGTHDALRPCISGSSDTLVYQTFSTDQYALAFHNVITRQVEIMTWKIGSGLIGSINILLEQEEKFKETIEADDEMYSLIGETKYDRVNRFKNKIEQVMERCLPGCTKRSVIRHIRKLKLKQINYKPECF